MLLRFEVSNHRSIKEAVEFSMIAIDTDRVAARPVESISKSVLATAGIYGPNASGKSNLLNSLYWLSRAVRVSLRSWDAFIPTEPFRFDDWSSKHSTFNIEMTVHGVRYSYSLEVNETSVIFEGLYSYPKQYRRTLFEREGADFSLRRGLGSISGTRELLTPTTLALSAAMRFDEPEVRLFAQELGGIIALGSRLRPERKAGSLRKDRPSSYETELMFFERRYQEKGLLLEDEHPEILANRDSALALLRFADLGIDDVEVIDEAGEIGPSRRRLRFVHSAAKENRVFDFEEESAGTQTWFGLIGPVLYALQSGRTVLFDEIDASLHPKLSARLVELFHDPKTNSTGAQLIFTTHDTSLLNHLNRDEVWLTEKGRDGATTLTALAEYGGDRVRRSLNLEKAYLQGRFGAVPELDQYMLRRALGVIPDDAE
jgi:hypothetical protein